MNVRSASPFLVGLLRGEHLTLDEAVHLINPVPGCPRRPRLSSAGSGALGPNLHMFRHYCVGLAAGVGHPPLRDEFLGHTFILGEGGHARMQVVGHSIEVEAKIGSVRFETRFGVLGIELDRSLPETLALASLGRDVEQIVDHPALRGRGGGLWRWSLPDLLSSGRSLSSRPVPFPTVCHRWRRCVATRLFPMSPRKSLHRPLGTTLEVSSCPG